MYILGLSFGIDSAACLVKDGQVIAGALEERFDRNKHSRAFPVNAIQFCLQSEHLTIIDIDYISFFWNPAIQLKHLNLRRSSHYRHHGEFFYLLPNYILDSFSQIKDTDLQYTSQYFKLKQGRTIKIFYIAHHLAHAAAAYFPSPFDNAAIITADGYGEKTCTMLAQGEQNTIEALTEIAFPNSLGAFYAAITEYLGFRPNSDEGKVMGLAPFGKPTFRDEFSKMFNLEKSDLYDFDIRPFGFYLEGQRRYLDKLVTVLGQPRAQGTAITTEHKNIARSAQSILEESLIRVANEALQKTGSKNLCIAGGVGLNSVANAKILDRCDVDRMYIQPVAHDGGASLGSALYLYHHILDHSQRFEMTNDYLGPQFSNQTIKAVLEKSGLTYHYYESIEEITAELLSQKKIIGWFQGHMEMGPRALGNRSIIADPRQNDMKRILNEKVKFREGFRPYAPSILFEKRTEYFEMNDEEPFMLKVYTVKKDKQKQIPAVVHVDGTARVQTVKEMQNPRYYKLIESFYKQTGIPLILNTSFNIQGEPIVCTVEDALKCYFTTGLDVLVLNNYVLMKND